MKLLSLCVAILLLANVVLAAEPFDEEREDYPEVNSGWYPFDTTAGPNHNMVCPGPRSWAAPAFFLRIAYGVARIALAVFEFTELSAPECPIPTDMGPCAAMIAFEAADTLIAETTLQLLCEICNTYTGPWDYFTTAGANIEASINMWSTYRKLTMQQHIHDDIIDRSGLLGYQLGLGRTGYVTPYDLMITDVENGNPSGTLQLEEERENSVYDAKKGAARTNYKLFLTVYEATYTAKQSADSLGTTATSTITTQLKKHLIPPVPTPAPTPPRAVSQPKNTPLGATVKNPTKTEASVPKNAYPATATASKGKGEPPKPAPRRF